MTLFWETISPAMRQVMAAFGRSAIGARFYLAGGTALALQLGHRRSFDLDFFSPGEDIPTIRQALADALHGFAPTLADASWGNLVFLAGGVRVGFYGYGYAMVAPIIEIESVRLASVADIALMKLDALLGRAGRKDIHDLYVICQRLPLRQLFDLAAQKCPATRDFEVQVVKRLAFFERADMEGPPTLLIDTPWETVKAFFRQQAADFGKSWLP
ncbi:MAG: nucleotidyl transferase AbiEii/AbiGii toxin family protein [Chloroflexi bacterium]|nr:nucleotidyl transferase AbiEii/AbiGii toxin family protein [Chloroflexota bacterium]